MLIIGQISTKEVLETQFGISFTEKQDYQPDYFIEQQKPAVVITSKKKQSFTFMNYGMIPFWSRHFLLHCEAPVEGEGAFSPSNILKKRIVLHPSFRRPVRETRCLVLADYLLVLISNGDVYMIYSAANRPFAIAGVYDTWKESFRDEISYTGFSVLTVPSNETLKMHGIENAPLILSPEEYKTWLNCDLPLTEITSIMRVPPHDAINGHLVKRELFIDRKPTQELLQSTGITLLPNYDVENSRLSSMWKSFRFGKGSVQNL